MKQTTKLAALVLSLIILGGCASLGTSFSLGVLVSPDDNVGDRSAVGPFENNSTVILDAGRYRGEFEIQVNGVHLEGAGSRSTLIDGDVYVSGNNNTISNLSIEGNVYLNGNNNTLRSVRVDGKVVSSGNNNSW